jgi:predicted RNA binding protein YcfA (HicA-like mRNA interferase family)
MKQREMSKILKANGYELIRMTKHHIYSNGKTTIALPNSHGSKDMNSHLVAGILKQIKIGNTL